MVLFSCCYRRYKLLYFCEIFWIFKHNHRNLVLGAVIITERVNNSFLLFKRQKRGLISSSRFLVFTTKLMELQRTCVCLRKSEREREREKREGVIGKVVRFGKLNWRNLWGFEIVVRFSRHVPDLWLRVSGFSGAIILKLLQTFPCTLQSHWRWRL
jgi:hypothetical protein